MPTIKECAMLADAAYGATPPAGFFEVSGLGVSGAQRKGFFGRMFCQERVGVISYRGSAETTDWIHSDTDIASGALPEQLGEAFSYFGKGRSILQGLGCNRIVIVGHSLGGALAALVGARVTTSPVRAVTFNAPGCNGFDRAGRWVDEDDQRLADTVDTARRALGDAKLNPVLRVGVAAGGALVAAFQAGGLAARRAMEAGVGNAKIRLTIPSGNARNVYNVVAVSRSGMTEIVSGTKSGFIGNQPYKIRVDILDPARAHMIGPLIKALAQAVEGTYRI
jgi:hypothetical protein